MGRRVNMHKYLFLLGRTPELSFHELLAFIPQEDLEQVTPEIVRASLESDEAASNIFSLLGGSLKVLKTEGEFHAVEEEKLPEYAAAFLAEFPRPTFAIAELGRNNIEKLDPGEIKRLLKARNVSSRFIEGPREGLSAAVLLHDDVVELHVMKFGETTFFARTLEVQDIDSWTERDRGKPYSDRKKGMLPVKVARMMVNMAMAQQKSQASDSREPVKLYDPFCGTGTVLIEAAMRGCQVFGSDLDQDSVVGTTRNLEWFGKTANLSVQSHIFHSDATNVTPDKLGGLVDTLVTEPFLGKPTPQAQQLPNIFKGLEKMYLGAFKQWTKILSPGASVVIIFPYVVEGKNIYSLEKMIDKLSSLGYTPLSEPLMYHRPQAIVQRQVWQFRFSK